MLQMTTYPSTLLIIVTVTLLYPSTLMSEPWKKSKNQTKITYLPMPPPEPVSQHALSECLAHSDLLPSQRQSMHTLLKENSGVFGSSIADFSSTPLVQYYIDTGNAKPIKQGLNFFKHTKLNVDFETNTVETRSTLYLANTHYMQSSNSTIIIPKSDVYRPCQLLLKRRFAGWLHHANYSNHTNRRCIPHPLSF